MSDYPPIPPSDSGFPQGPPARPPTPTQSPTYTGPPTTTSKGRTGLWITVAALVALLVGVGIGYAASQPSKNDLAQERDDAQQEVAQLKEQNAQLADQVAELEDQKATVEETATAAGSARDTCSKAAADANDLIDQHESLWDAWDAYILSPPGSEEETQILDQMDTQISTMETQNDVVRDELAECKAAVDS